MTQAAAAIRPRVAAPAPALPVSLQGALLQPAELRVGFGGGMQITVRLVIEQPGDLPPVCAELRPSADPANYILWRQRVRDYARGRMVCIEGFGLRTRMLNGRRVLMLDHTHSVRLLQPPFDARAAAAGLD